MATATKSLPQAKKKASAEDREILFKAAKDLLTHWMRIRDFLLLSFQNDPITREQEQTFLELKSETARTQRVVGSKIPENLKFGADRITELLRQAISVAHLRGLPVADKMGLVGSWHFASVMLHRAVGALEYLAEGHAEVAGKKGGIRGIKAIKAEAAGGTKRSKTPLIIAAVVVVAGAIAAAVYFFGM